MFMMPTPPTTSDTPATARKQDGEGLGRRRPRLEDLRHVLDGEVVVLTRLDLVAFAQHLLTPSWTSSILSSEAALM